MWNALKVVGVNIGALSVKIVALQGEEKWPEIVAHHGRPLAVLEKLLAEKLFADGDYFWRCLPLPICVGQLLEIHERRAPGEITLKRPAVGD